MSKKIKKAASTVKPCTHCFSPIYIKYNLSYFKPPKRFPDDVKAQFLDRMIALSQDPYLVLMQRPKSTGFEFEEIDIEKEIPKDFKERFKKKTFPKFAIMRLYPNNNPLVARIVGITINQVFYVFYLFYDGEGYKR